MPDVGIYIGVDRECIRFFVAVLYVVDTGIFDGAEVEGLVVVTKIPTPGLKWGADLFYRAAVFGDLVEYGFLLWHIVLVQLYDRLLVLSGRIADLGEFYYGLTFPPGDSVWFQVPGKDLTCFPGGQD